MDWTYDRPEDRYEEFENIHKTKRVCREERSERRVELIGFSVNAEGIELVSEAYIISLSTAVRVRCHRVITCKADNIQRGPTEPRENLNRLFRTLREKGYPYVSKLDG